MDTNILFLFVGDMENIRICFKEWLNYYWKGIVEIGSNVVLEWLIFCTVFCQMSDSDAISNLVSDSDAIWNFQPVLEL